MLDINDLEESIFKDVKQKTDALFSGSNSAMGVTPEDKANVANETSNNKPWFGLNRSDILGMYKTLYKEGFQRKSFYLVKFLPYKNNATRLTKFVTNSALPWLVSDLNLSVLQIDTDSKKIGHYNVNHITGSQLPEIALTMLETKNNDVLSGLIGLKSLMCKADGSMGLPAEYAMWLEIRFFSENGIDKPSFAQRYLCYPTQASVDMSASDNDVLRVPITFTQAYPLQV